ncbi:hypothetical protein DFJ77DRAFT_449228 [Powellomyces hirtus]|nr:hypothetical protein DFJ77DRAFT_449228 [Powellomyces hirtus]
MDYSGITSVRNTEHDGQLLDTSTRQQMGQLRRRPSQPSHAYPGGAASMAIEEDTDEDGGQETRKDRVAGASSIRVGSSGAMRRGVKKFVQRVEGSKLDSLEKGTSIGDMGVPSWAEHRSAGEVVLFNRGVEAVASLILLLGTVILLVSLHQIVIKTALGPPIIHAALALCGMLINWNGSRMVRTWFFLYLQLYELSRNCSKVGATIQHALSVILLSRGADAYILASNYQSGNSFLLIFRAVKCSMRNATTTRNVEFMRLALTTMLLLGTWSLSGVLSFAMVSVEWKEIPTAMEAAACRKPVYGPLTTSQRIANFFLADSVTPAVFEKDGHVAVIGTMLPNHGSNAYVTGDGHVITVTSTTETTTEACKNVPLNVSSSADYNVWPLFCDSSHLTTVDGARVWFKLGVPATKCLGCSSSSSYTYLSVSANLEYFTSQITAKYGDAVSGLTRGEYISHEDLIPGIDPGLAANIKTIYTNPGAVLVTGGLQGRVPAMFTSTSSEAGQYLAAPSDMQTARSVAAILQAIMMSYTTSVDASCMISWASGYGHAEISDWVVTAVTILATFLGTVVLLTLWEVRNSVRQVHPHAYVRGLSIVQDPLRFMVAMRDCTGFWDRVTGGCDASGDLLREASAGLMCKYGEEKATRQLEIGHLMFGPPDDITQIRDGREYSGREDKSSMEQYSSQRQRIIP